MSDVTIEAYIKGQWRNITSDVYQRDGVGLDIARAYRGDSDSLTAGEISFELNNAGGVYSPHNPMSPYANHIKQNIPIRAYVSRVVVDDFTPDVVNGWGTTDTGDTWTLAGSGGSVLTSQWQKTGGLGTISVPVANGFRWAILNDLLERDFELVFDFHTNVGTPTGAIIGLTLQCRRASGMPDYEAEVEILTDGTIRVYGESPGGNTSANVTIPDLVNVAGEFMTVRMQMEDRTIRMKVWKTTEPEPLGWHHTINSTDFEDPAALYGSVAVIARVMTSYSGALPVVFTFDNLEVRRQRGNAEIPNLPEEWDSTGQDAFERITAGGILRRIGRGERPLRSSLYRGLTLNDSPNLVEYWACEDGSDSDSLASEIGGTPIGFTVWNPDNQPRLAAYSEFVCSEPIPVLNNVEWRADVRPYTVTDQLEVRWLTTWPVPADEPATGQAVVQLWFNTGTVRRLDLQYVAGGSGQGDLQLKGFTSIGVEFFDSGALGMSAAEKSGRAFITLTQVGADIGVSIGYRQIDGKSSTSVSSSATNIPTQTLGRLQQIVVNPAGGFVEIPFGHLAVHNDAVGVFAETQYLIAHYGETALTRFDRVMTEEGIPSQWTRGYYTSMQMDVQRTTTIFALLEDLVETTGGLIFEMKGDLGLHFTVLGAMYNMPAMCELDYSAGQVQPPFRPAIGDKTIRNAWTVNRIDGSSARYELTSGPLSVAPSPAGIGLYEDTASISPMLDSELDSHAAWRTHVTSANESRFAQLTTHLSKVGMPAVELMSVNPGQRLQVVDSETIGRYDGISQLVRGYREKLRPLSHEIEWSCRPESPYRVVVVDDPEARAESDGSELADDADDTATELYVLVRDMDPVVAPPWTTDGAVLPFDVRLGETGGERCTLTAVADTITFVSAGSAAHAANASVAPGLPGGRAVGDLLLIVGATRASAQGVPTAPDGYEDLVAGTGNVKLFGRVADGSETTPTMGFSGAGAAGMSVSAVMLAFRSEGGFRDLARAVYSSRAVLNGSVQDVAYPLLHVSLPNTLAVVVGWKQDDWTSVAGPGTEVVDTSTTLGDDQGLWVGYEAYATADTEVPGGNLTVTGGGAAASRGIVLLLHSDIQRFTVTRSVNGVVRDQEAGVEVALFHTPTVPL